MSDAERNDLIDYIVDMVRVDLESVMPQTTGYGAVDLEIMGDALLHLIPGGEHLPRRVGIEAAIMFYLLGKVSRQISGLKAGQFPSNDTIKDTMVYGIMARYVRNYGQWGQIPTTATIDE